MNRIQFLFFIFFIVVNYKDRLATVDLNTFNIVPFYFSRPFIFVLIFFLSFNLKMFNIFFSWFRH